MAPRLAAMFPFAADYDLGVVLSWLAAHDGQSRERVPSPTFLLQTLAQELTAGGYSAPPAGASPTAETPAMTMHTLTRWVFPVLIKMAPRDVQLAWLTDPADPRWGPSTSAVDLEGQIARYLHGVEGGDPAMTIAAARHVGPLMALRHHRGGYGPVPEDFASSPQLRQMAADVLALPRAGLLRSDQRLLEGMGIRLIQGLAQWCRTADDDDAVTPERLDREPDLTTLWHSGTQARSMLMTLPVLAPTVHAHWQAEIGRLAQLPARRPPSAPGSDADPFAVDIEMIRSVLEQRPTVVLADGAAWWQARAADAMPPSVRTALLDLLSTGWPLANGHMPTQPPHAQELDATHRLALGPEWAPVLATLRAPALSDPHWVWTAPQATPERRTATLDAIGQEDPAVLGERLVTLWTAGWQDDIRAWLLAPRRPALGAPTWRPMLLHEDPDLRLTAVRAMRTTERETAPADPTALPAEPAASGVSARRGR